MKSVFVFHQVVFNLQIIQNYSKCSKEDHLVISDNQSHENPNDCQPFDVKRLQPRDNLEKDQVNSLFHTITII